MIRIDLDDKSDVLYINFIDRSPKESCDEKLQPRMVIYHEAKTKDITGITIHNFVKNLNRFV